MPQICIVIFYGFCWLIYLHSRTMVVGKMISCSLAWVLCMIGTNKNDFLFYRNIVDLWRLPRKYISLKKISMPCNIYRFWQRSLEQLWFPLSIAIMERVLHLNIWQQKIWDIFHPSKHSLIWLFSARVIRQVQFFTFLFDDTMAEMKPVD